MSTEASKIPGMQSDQRRWVIFAQAVLAFGIWWSLAQTFALIYRAAKIPTFNPFGVSDWHWVAFAVVGAAFIYTLRNPTVQEFANDVLVELRKVTWPSWKETRQSTLVVIVTVFIVGMILGGFDLIWAKVIRYIINTGTGT